MPLLKDKHGKRMAKRDGSESLEDWKKSGFSTEQLVAKFAIDLGLLPMDQEIHEITAKQLLRQLSLEQFERTLSQDR